MHFARLSLISVLLAAPAFAQDWADPEHPEIDYSGSYGMIASDNGKKEMFGWWSWGSEADAYPEINQLMIAKNNWQLMNNHEDWSLAGECLDGTLVVALDHDVLGEPQSFAVAEDGYIDVNYTVDDNRYEEGWIDAMQNGARAALFNQDAKEVLAEFARSDTVTFEVTSADGTAQTLPFDMAGAEKVIPALFEACGV